MCVPTLIMILIVMATFYTNFQKLVTFFSDKSLSVKCIIIENLGDKNSQNNKNWVVKYEIKP